MTERCDDFPPPLQVRVPRDRCDPFGGQDSVETHISHEMESTNSEDVAKLLESDESYFLELLHNLSDVLNVVFWRVVVEDAGFIDVPSSAFEVYQSNNIIEDVFNFFYWRIFLQAFYGFLYDSL
jgi:hypothetical protein